MKQIFDYTMSWIYRRRAEPTLDQSHLVSSLKDPYKNTDESQQRRDSVRHQMVTAEGDQVL